jgi:hypothetical protein
MYVVDRETGVDAPVPLVVCYLLSGKGLLMSTRHMLPALVSTCVPRWTRSLLVLQKLLA